MGGCDPRMQRKMYKDALTDVGVNFEEQIVPLDLRNMTTSEAIERVKKAVEEVTGS